MSRQENSSLNYGEAQRHMDAIAESLGFNPATDAVDPNRNDKKDNDYGDETADTRESSAEHIKKAKEALGKILISQGFITALQALSKISNPEEVCNGLLNIRNTNLYKEIVLPLIRICNGARMYVEAEDVVLTETDHEDLRQTALNRTRAIASALLDPSNRNESLPEDLAEQVRTVLSSVNQGVNSRANTNRNERIRLRKQQNEITSQWTLENYLPTTEEVSPTVTIEALISDVKAQLARYITAEMVTPLANTDITSAEAAGEVVAGIWNADVYKNFINPVLDLISDVEELYYWSQDIKRRYAGSDRLDHLSYNISKIKSLRENIPEEINECLSKLRSMKKNDDLDDETWTNYLHVLRGIELAMKLMRVISDEIDNETRAISRERYELHQKNVDELAQRKKTEAASTTEETGWSRLKSGIKSMFKK